MNILGISGLPESAAFKRRKFPDLDERYYRVVQGLDSAAAIITDNAVYAAAEERFCRDKGTGRFPRSALQYCLAAANLRPEQVDYLAHAFNYEKYEQLFHKIPFEHERYMNVYASDILSRQIESNFPGTGLSSKLVPVEHHLAHAASAFYPSGFEEALVLVTDGMGEYQSSSVFHASSGGLTLLDEISGLHSLGVLYGVFTLYLGFWMGFDEYKVMGLAPYGNPRRYYNECMNLICLQSNGRYTIPLLFSNESVLEKETYATSLRTLADIFGPARAPHEAITQRHHDIAAAIQAALQTAVIHVLDYWQDQVQSENLCMAGGVALNCVNNGVIRRSKIFKSMYVQPASGDDGAALGAALVVRARENCHVPSALKSLPLWGPAYSTAQIEEAIQRSEPVAVQYVDCEDELVQLAARRLAEGQILAWFQGEMEFGPRALGNRSILADPRPENMRDRVNALIKKREGFRPFAPIVTQEKADSYFMLEDHEAALFSTMLFVTQVRPEKRSALPAVTHVDGSARVQTVDKKQRSRLWKLLSAFESETEIPVLLNTSFNVKGQAIVCTPLEAISTFLSAGLDALVMENFLITRPSAGQ